MRREFDDQLAVLQTNREEKVKELLAYRVVDGMSDGCVVGQGSNQAAGHSRACKVEEKYDAYISKAAQHCDRDATQQETAQHSTAWDSTAQHSTAQRGTARHSTGQDLDQRLQWNFVESLYDPHTKGSSSTMKML